MSQSKKYERSLGVKTTVKQTPASIGVHGTQWHAGPWGGRRDSAHAARKKEGGSLYWVYWPFNWFILSLCFACQSISICWGHTHPPLPLVPFFNKQKSLYRLVLAYSEVSIALIIIMQDYSERQGQLRRKASDVARCARRNKETHT